MAFVTLCRLGGPMVLYNAGRHPRGRGRGTGDSRTNDCPLTNGSPLLTDPPANGAPCLTRMSHSILGGNAHGADAPSDILSRAGTVFDLITTGDPFDLTGGKVGAGSESRHRVGVVWFFRILRATPHRIRQGVCGCQTVTRSTGCHRYR